LKNLAAGGDEFPRILTLELRQDDPSKCTSAKMVKFGIAKRIGTKGMIPRDALVLSPSARRYVLPSDRERAIRFGLVVIDCSWNLASGVFATHFKGEQRRLPALMAGNPTNYSKIGVLSSIEAVSGSLYILGFKAGALKILSLYKWGQTFLTLNHDPLEEYSSAETNEKIAELENSYFPESVANHNNQQCL
jgi:pre-rRNA-processing protein TSR3